jgi:hypothetical protein
MRTISQYVNSTIADGSDPVFMMYQNYLQTKVSRDQIGAKMMHYLRPVKIDGKIEFVPLDSKTREFEALLDKEAFLRERETKFEENFKLIESLVAEAEKSSETIIDTPSASGIQKIANMFTSRNANAILGAKRDLEERLSRGLPVRDASARLVSIQEGSDEAIKSNNKKVEALHEIAVKVSALYM